MDGRLSEKSRRLRMGPVALRAAAAVLGLSIGMAATGASAEPFVPERNATMVVTSSAGGGSDIISRTISNILTRQKIIPVEIVVENRPGGSGAVGFNYAAKKKGDPYTIANFALAFFTTPLLGNSPVTYKDFTPLASVAVDPYIMVVSAKSEIKSLDDLKAKGSVVSGTTGVASDPSLIAHLLKAGLDIPIQIVPYGGDGEVTSALLGGHVDVQFGNPSEVLPLIKAGEVRPIAISATERLEALPDVPTFKELGHDIELMQVRGFVLPKDVDPEAAKYWADAFKKATETEEWKKEYIDRFNVQPAFAAGADMQAQMDQIHEKYTKILTDLDLIKK